MERRNCEELKSHYHSGIVDQTFIAIAEMCSLASLFFTYLLLYSIKFSPATYHLSFLTEI